MLKVGIIVSLLEKRNWFLNLILLFLSGGTYYLVLAYYLGIYDKDAWYGKWQYWVFGSLCLIFPLFIFLMVFLIQITCNVAKKLKVPGSQVYMCPYFWIISIIFPIVGWVFLITVLIYIYIWPIVMLYRGKGDDYLK